MSAHAAVVRFLDAVVDHVQYVGDGRVVDYAFRARFVADCGGDPCLAGELRVARDEGRDGGLRCADVTAPAPGDDVRLSERDVARIAEHLELVILGYIAGHVVSPPGSYSTCLERPVDLGYLHVDANVERGR